MFQHYTPVHNAYHTMTCQCPQCQQDRNIPTALLPRVDQLPPKVVITEIISFTAIDAETGARVTYNLFIPR